MTEIHDVYSRITNKIVADLEQGVRPWMKPSSSEHAAGRISRPVRHNGIPYKGINVVMLWSAATSKGYDCPLWLTFKQALELGGNVRKGETGELVVYANHITRTETDNKGKEQERDIPFLKGYTVFNAEQCDGLPAHHSAPALPLPSRLSTASSTPIALCQHWRRHPPWRHTSLLQPCPRLRADARVRDLPGCREPRSDAGARADPMDPPRQPAGVGFPIDVTSEAYA